MDLIEKLKIKGSSELTLNKGENWRESFKKAFQDTKKRLIVRIVDKSIVDDFNIVARTATVNVSYLDMSDYMLAVVGKKLDDVVFTLDDFHETNHNLPILLDLKQRFPKLKVTLFTIPAKSPIPFLMKLKDQYGSWMQFAVHGWFHDVDGRVAQEANYWRKDEALKYLEMAEDMNVFEKGFKAPGWQMNHETYEALKERGYWIMDHEQYKHIRPADFTNYYETGHLWEVNGHIQDTPFNGLVNLVENKLNFLSDSNFYFVSEMVGTEKDNQRLNKIYASLKT